MTAAMMLTAFDAEDGKLLDLTAMVDDLVIEYHGQRNRRRHHHAPQCRGCGGDVHIVHGHSGVWFWRHNPGRAARGCLVEELGRARRGMSPEHLLGVARVAGGIRQLTGWTADVEAFHGEVRLDIEATFRGVGRHDRQRSAAWEVQVSDQPDSVFADRTEHIATTTGLPTLWVTPHADRVGDLEALIVDPAVETVTSDRLLVSYSPWVTAPPMALDRVVRSLLRPAPGHRLAPVGEHGEWHVVDVNAFGGPVAPRRPRPVTPDRDVDVGDRDCNRQPVSFDVPLLNVPRTHLGSGAEPPLRHMTQPAGVSFVTPAGVAVAGDANASPAAAARVANATAAGGRKLPPAGRKAHVVTPAERVRCGHSLASRWPDGRVRCSWCGLGIDELHKTRP